MQDADVEGGTEEEYRARTGSGYGATLVGGAGVRSWAGRLTAGLGGAGEKAGGKMGRRRGWAREKEKEIGQTNSAHEDF